MFDVHSVFCRGRQELTPLSFPLRHTSFFLIRLRLIHLPFLRDGFVMYLSRSLTQLCRSLREGISLPRRNKSVALLVAPVIQRRSPTSIHWDGFVSFFLIVLSHHGDAIVYHVPPVWLSQRCVSCGFETDLRSCRTSVRITSLIVHRVSCIHAFYVAPTVG